ncbi:MAG: leucine-rich repeat domain-containing protein, partial [Bifidobacteriaceae bacterium]|nr:leucine-rich repeat domain-containing protein [Bifidobacteriaceae bacterium]
FDGVQEYGTFGLAYTNLTSLPAGLFADTQLVGYLLLDHNQLTTIPADLLATAPSGFVHLDHNQLTEIPDGLLSSFPGGYIDFEDNPIAALPADICQVPHQVVLRGTGVYKATCPDGSIPYDHGVELLVDQQLPTYVFYAAAVDQPLASWTPGPGVVLIQGPTGQVNRVATSAAYANPWFDGTTVTAPFVVTADGLQAVINATASPVWSVERDDWSLFNQAVGLVGLTIQLRQFPPVQAWDTSVLLGDTIEPDVLLPEDLLPGYTRTVRYEVLDGAAYVTVDPVTGRITGRAGGTAVIRVTVSTVEDPSLQSVAEFDVEVVAVVEGPTDPATTGPGSTGTGGPATNPLLDPVSLSQGAAATSGSVVAQGGTAASGSETAATAASQAQATPTALSVSGQGQDAGPTLAFALLAGLTGLAAWSWSRRQRGPRHIAKHLA